MHLVMKLTGCIWDELTQEELVTINKKNLGVPQEEQQYRTLKKE
jgi:hypothetical protein